MKKLRVLTAVFAATLFTAGTALAADNTASVGASATIGASTSLSLLTKAIADDSTQDEFKFGAVTETYQLGQDYIEIDASSNYGTWKVDIYSDNWDTAPDTTTWGLQYGGLVDKTSNAKLPLGWAAFADKPADISTESLGDPGSTDPANRWTYLKDKADTDWETAQGEGYAVVAYGGTGYSTVTNPNVEGGDDLSEMPFYVYLETAADAVPGTYEGTIGLDLYNE